MICIGPYYGEVILFQRQYYFILFFFKYDSKRAYDFEILYFNLKVELFNVFQILTDAALLKRQKIEIEELRRKLQVP